MLLMRQGNSSLTSIGKTQVEVLGGVSLEDLQQQALELMACCDAAVKQADEQGLDSPSLQDLVRMSLFVASSVSEQIQAGGGAPSGTSRAIPRLPSRVLVEAIAQTASSLARR